MRSVLGTLQKAKNKKSDFLSNLCRNWSVCIALFSLDGPGLDTDALLTWPLDEIEAFPRLNSVRVLLSI